MSEQDERRGLNWTAPAVQYGFAVASVCAITALRLALTPFLRDRGQYLLFVPAVLVSAYYGGVGPGVLAIILSIVMALVVINDPTKILPDPAHQVGLLLYVLVCGGILLMSRREREQKQQRKHAERELATLNAELEARVKERTVQLENANKELRGFCYSVSHDLRTPMRAIAGNARILVEDHAEGLGPELRERLERIEIAANKLGVLVEGLLTYARLASQELDRETINLADYARDAVRSATREFGCEVRLEVPAEIRAYADQKMVRLAINELVKNAVVYRKPGEEACLEIGEKNEDGQRVFYLRDCGIGFDLSYVRKVFLPFERLHRDEDYPGVGMGLAHVKRVIDRHEGEIWVDSKPGAGSCFSFTLSQTKV